MNAVVVPGDFDKGLTFYEVSPSTEALWQHQLVKVQGRCLSTTSGHDRATRRLWPALALPGTFWLIALFLVPFYAVMAVAFSGNINIFGEPIPAWNPLDWEFRPSTASSRTPSPARTTRCGSAPAIYSFWALVDLRRWSATRWPTTRRGWPENGAA